MPSFFYDLRFALRQLRKVPGMALLAIITLALGVGANAAIFTVIENVLLRPLPYAHPDRLFSIGSAGGKTAIGATSYLNYRDIRTQSRLFEQVAGYSEDLTVIQTQDTTQSVVAPRVTPNLFSMLGAHALLGRTFTDAEGQTGGAQAVILSEGLWRETFHADPGIVGRTIRIGGVARTVVGVMPDSFLFPDSIGPDDMRKGLWLPLQPSKEMLSERGYDFFNVVGELRPGVTQPQAQQEINAIAARIPREHGQRSLHFRDRTVSGGFNRPGAPGPVRAFCRPWAGPADRLRQRLQPADCALPLSPAGICRPRGPGVRPHAAGPAAARRGPGAEFVWLRPRRALR